MYSVYYCLTVEHDLRLVAIAAVLCLVSAIAATATTRRSALASARQRLVWLLMSGFVTGVGIWGTHFVAMLAYEPPVPVSYGPVGTIGTLLFIVTVCICGWTYAVRAGHRYSEVVGGALIGAGIASMHFMGIETMNIGGRIEWDAGLVIAAILVGVQASVLSALFSIRMNSRRGLAAAAGSLALGVVTLHFLSMGAMRVVPDPFIVDAAAGISPKLLAVTVALGVVIVVAGGLAAAAFDLHLGVRRREETRRVRAFANATFEGIAVVRQGILIDMNDRLCDMLKLGRADLLGTPLTKVALDEAALDGLGRASDGEAVTVRLKCRDGLPLSVLTRSRTMDFNGSDVQIFAFHDVSSEEHARARMAHLAHHDTLTGLPNRLKFRSEFESAIERAWANDTQVALMFFDLDRFKEVNDVHGHSVGDDLLKTVSERIIDALPKHATAARLSGDEFAVVLPHVTRRIDAITIAQRVVNNVGTPLTLGKLHINVSASGGVTLFPLDGEDPDRLMNQADLALYRAKGQGRNQVCDFDPKLGQMMQERRMLEADLSMALEDELLDLHFQPQARIGDGEIVGYEALVRWEDARRGFVSPAEFVQIAEETGMILKMGEWVLESACREAMTWPDEQSISVNVSPAQFRQGNFVHSVEMALRASGLAPERLDIEITEGVLIDDEERALEVLQGLKALGVRLSIDDFGTGYSSLAYLRTFPFDKIKIDRAFITGIQTDREAQIIVQATTELARALDIAVVIEGVETFEELGALGHQPDLILQGYLLSRPITRGQIRTFEIESEALRQEISRQVNSAGSTGRESRRHA